MTGDEEPAIVVLTAHDTAAMTLSRSTPDITLAFDAFAAVCP